MVSCILHVLFTSLELLLDDFYIESLHSIIFLNFDV
jgi:hypothetical protein